MTFKEALKILHIEKYEDRIINSNSHGELFHIYDYFEFAEFIQKGTIDVSFFVWAFEAAVEFCEKNWQRPESCFQHMPRLLCEIFRSITNKKL